MTTNNSINLDLSVNPFPVASGGLGTATFVVGLLLGNGSSAITSSIAPGASGNYLMQGLTTFVAGPSGSYYWNFVTTTSKQMDINNNFVTNNASQVVVTLPTTADVGTPIRITNYGAGGFKIAQNSGQKIVVGTTSSTIGVTGSVSSNSTYSSIQLICSVANTTWVTAWNNGAFTIV